MKKPLYKKWWFWVIIVVLVLYAAGTIAGDEEVKEKEPKTKQEEEKTKEPIEKEQDDEEESKKKEKVESKAETKKEEEEKDNRTIDEVIMEENKEVDKATFKDGTLTLISEGKTTFSENTLFFSVYDMFEVMHDAFQNKEIKEVYVELTSTMVDQKGNESIEPVIKYNYSRESFEKLNYETFANMAYSEEWRILVEADYYYIHPGIYKNLKDKYKDNLNVEGFNN